ncbi:MAG: amidohydrolase [Weeksellaceae bacterium]|nr:amidohydrolase [Weeksellaceae bacterium]
MMPQETHEIFEEKNDMLTEIITLRKTLHRHPELSGQEMDTARRILEFIATHHDTEMITDIGGNGLAAVYHFSDDGPVVVIRCELDALPIAEINQFEHRSVNAGVSHKCGHDGHMAVLAGLAIRLKEKNFKKGKVVLLFQPAEENGEGAHAVLESGVLKNLKPDYFFALHNLPGEETNAVIVVDHFFSASVQSVCISLQGKQCHASEPENGVNPAIAMAKMIDALADLNITDETQDGFALLTPVYMTMGEKAYGISAGSGELHYTLRTWNDEKMEELKTKLSHIVTTVSNEHALQHDISWFDYFPASVNDPKCNELIRKAAAGNGFTVKERPLPFKFGEDFGWYSAQYPSAMFGLGAGLNSPALHHHDYDFPDEITGTGIGMFCGIIDQLLGEPELLQKTE